MISGGCRVRCLAPRPALAFATSLATLAAVAAGAQVTPNGDPFQVNSYTTGYQPFPAVACDAAGGFVVAWSSSGSPGDDQSYTSIQAQRFGPDATPLGGQWQVNTFTDFIQMHPAVALDPAGNFVVAWASFGSPGGDTGYSVQARRYTTDGTPFGDQFQVNGYTTGAQAFPAVAVTPAGELLLVWASEGSSGPDSSSSSVQLQRYDAGGAPLGGEVQVNTYTTSSQRFPAVAADSLARFVVVWNSYGSTGSDTDLGSIQARRFESDGTPMGDGFQVNTVTSGAQDRPRIAVADDGDFVVVWQSVGSVGTDSSAESVQAQRFDAAGTPLGAQFQVNTYTTNAQSRPAVAGHAHGFVVTWTSVGSAGSDADAESVQARLYAWDGTPASDEWQVNTYTTSVQNEIAVGSDPNGDFVVAWQSTGSFGTDTESTSVQARRYDGLFRDGFETGGTSRWSGTIP